MDFQDASGIIRFLDARGVANAIDLRAVIPTYDRMKKLLDTMKDEGLVDVVFEESPRIKYTYSLTEKGKKVAKKIKEIDEIINS